MDNNNSVVPPNPPLRRTALVLAVAAALTVPTLACAADAQGKRRASHWHGYGFLPGYVPPEKFDALLADAVAHAPEAA